MPTESAKGRVFIAGASGVVGRSLCRLLVSEGWQVSGTTRSAHKAELLKGLGVLPVIVDVYDEAALREHMLHAAPEIVVHQLTDLSGLTDPQQISTVLAQNARLREEGTRSLVAAAAAAGARRMVAQSIAFAYAPGPRPYKEDAALAVDDAQRGQTARAVASLEQQVLGGPFESLVLRYGKFYGAGSGADQAPAGGAVHVHAAADAARRALTHGAAGIYNIAEQDGTVSSAKAIAELGWNPAFRMETE